MIVEPLLSSDAIALAQSIAIEVDAFPHAAEEFGLFTAFARVLVARMPGEALVVGFAAARWRGREAYVERLAVDRHCRRRGVGRALLHALVTNAQAAQASGLILHVSVANSEALRLYRAEDFIVRRRVHRFYRPGVFDRDGDAYEMFLTLSSPSSA
ncbi:MAG TPA: GNAT family N-acetyltransferase [Polyangiaceae bacterium]|nr:GNAT family N-acetyltransferase [Polyangiaceae bacterium]